MSHLIIKPVYAIYKQQRHRSACASAQSDQHLCFHCQDSIIPLVSISKISSLYLASVAAQAGLSLTWLKCNTAHALYYLSSTVYSKQLKMSSLNEFKSFKDYFKSSVDITDIHQMKSLKFGIAG